MNTPKDPIESVVESFKDLCKHNGIIGAKRISLSLFLLHTLTAERAKAEAGKREMVEAIKKRLMRHMVEKAPLIQDIVKIGVKHGVKIV